MDLLITSQLLYQLSYAGIMGCILQIFFEAASQKIANRILILNIMAITQSDRVMARYEEGLGAIFVLGFYRGLGHILPA